MRSDDESVLREALLELAHFPIIVAAEGQQRLKCRISASPERSLEAIELGNCAADLDGVKLGLAFLFLDHCFFRFGDEARLELPIAPHSFCRFAVDPLG